MAGNPPIKLIAGTAIKRGQKLFVDERTGMVFPTEEQIVTFKTCVDCGNVDNSMDYMVDNFWWRLAGYHKKDFACLECLNNRLLEKRGEGLKWDDFNLALPINAALKFAMENLCTFIIRVKKVP